MINTNLQHININEKEYELSNFNVIEGYSKDIIDVLPEIIRQTFDIFTFIAQIMGDFPNSLNFLFYTLFTTPNRELEEKFRELQLNNQFEFSFPFMGQFLEYNSSLQNFIGKSKKKLQILINFKEQEKLKSELTALEEELEYSEQVYKSRELKRKKKLITQLETEISELKQEFAYLSDDYTQIQEKMKEHENQLKLLLKTKNSLKAEEETLHEEIARLNSESLEKTQNRFHYEEIIDDLEFDNPDLDEEELFEIEQYQYCSENIKELNKEIEEIDLRKKAAQAEAMGKHKKIKSLKQKEKQKKKQIQSLKPTLLQLEKKHRHLHERIDTQQQNLQKNTVEFQDLLSKESTAPKEKRGAVRPINEVQDEIKKKTETLESIAQNLAKYKKTFTPIEIDEYFLSELKNLKAITQKYAALKKFPEKIEKMLSLSTYCEKIEEKMNAILKPPELWVNFEIEKPPKQLNSFSIELVISKRERKKRIPVSYSQLNEKEKTWIQFAFILSTLDTFAPTRGTLPIIYCDKNTEKKHHWEFQEEDLIEFIKEITYKKPFENQFFIFSDRRELKLNSRLATQIELKK